MTSAASPEQSFEEKLLGSASARSLLAEHAIAARLAKLHWHAEHSVYYIDRSTGKARETDVIARQFWARRTPAGELTTTIELVVESKTLKGWHLIFLPAKAPRFGDHRIEHWLGWELDFHTQKAMDALTRAGLSPDELKGALTEIEKWSRSLARDDRSPIFVEPPASPQRARAFRETNTDKEKEEPADSVLWRASQATFSAINSITESLFTKEIDDVKFGLLLGDALGADRTGQAVAWLKDGLRRSVHFHPVVVMEAELRMLRGKKLQTVPWLRLELRSIDGNADRWVDVVNASAFDAYAETVTQAYVEQMQAAGAKRWRRHRKKSTKVVRK